MLKTNHTFQIYNALLSNFFRSSFFANLQRRIFNYMLILIKIFWLNFLRKADSVESFFRSVTWIISPKYAKGVSFLLLICMISLNACNTPVNVGIKKDFNTGLIASYSGMEPEKVLLVMNDEVLNHTDIPLGEDFLLVNDGIKGLQVKNGKVMVGCSLNISDEKGKILLDEKDLFAGHDIFEEKDAKMLKCTVGTGKPMEWEEKYNVSVTFWDKNGTGRIENKVTIRCIDIP